MTDHNHELDPPAPPEEVDVEIWWKDTDQTNSHYERITGSSQSGDYMVLNRGMKAFIINMRETVAVVIQPSEKSDVTPGF